MVTAPARAKEAVRHDRRDTSGQKQVVHHATQPHSSHDQIPETNPQATHSVARKPQDKLPSQRPLVRRQQLLVLSADGSVETVGGVQAAGAHHLNGSSHTMPVADSGDVQKDLHPTHDWATVHQPAAHTSHLLQVKSIDRHELSLHGVSNEGVVILLVTLLLLLLMLVFMLYSKLVAAREAALLERERAVFIDGETNEETARRKSSAGRTSSRNKRRSLDAGAAASSADVQGRQSQVSRFMARLSRGRSSDFKGLQASTAGETTNDDKTNDEKDATNDGAGSRGRSSMTKS